MAETTPENVQVPYETFEALHLDALRYSYLRAVASGTTPHMDGTCYWHVPSHAFRFRAHTFDEAIDLARQDALEGIPLEPENR